MKAAKRFRWEAAHRLPWHEGECQYLHGHSYHMMVELEGEPDERGMLIDFKDIKRALDPLIDRWDHATLVAKDDKKLLEAVRSLGSKYEELPFDSTAENLCTYVADYLERYLKDEAEVLLKERRIKAIRVKIQETETCYAEIEKSIEQLTSTGTESKPHAVLA